MPVASVLRKLGGAIGRRSSRWFEDIGHRHFDRLVASTLRKGRFQAVVGYEGSTERAFTVAKDLQITTILDAASLHYETQLQMNSGDGASPARLRQKAAEIRLADVILVPSILARESYERAGIPPEKLHVVPLGVNLGEFRPCRSNGQAPFTFAFAGNLTISKGVDLLLQAFGQLRRLDRPMKLRLFGTGDLERSVVAPDIEWAGRVAHHVLARELPCADCVVLPSRFDSYGLVVAEALASGVPVIVSDMVGAKDLVDRGRSGWIFPSGDLDALVRAMTACLENAAQRELWREAARNSSQKADWQIYHQTLANTVDQILSRRK